MMPHSERDPNAVTGYVYTYSGKRVDLDGENAPTIEDIAIHLGRIPRFVGATVGWWTVLHHSLAAQRIAQREGWRAHTQLVALLHDAHEALTGDIPSPFKTAEMRELQADFDRRIWNSIGIDPSDAARTVVHRIDQALLGAEGALVGPPTGEDDWWSQVHNEYSERAEEVVDELYGLWEVTSIHPGGRMVLTFINTALDLIERNIGEHTADGSN